MTKLDVNSRIHKYSLIGKVEEHDLKLDQAVLVESDVTFNSLTTTEDVTIGGNLTVNGATTIISTNTLQVQDNIIELNIDEVGSGVTANVSGIEVERGTLTNHQMVFQESSDTWRIGEVGGLQALATREDNPLINGIMTWNDTQKRLDSSNQINIDIVYTGSNPVSSSTGGIRMTGGIGIQEDAYIGGTLYLEGLTKSSLSTDVSDNLTISAPSDINLNAIGDINIPDNVGISFANDDSRIESNGTNLSITSSTGNIVVNSGNELQLTSSGNASLDSTSVSIATVNSGSIINIGHSVSETTIGDNLVVNGNLTVTGSVTTVESETLLVQDNTIVINSGPSSTVDAGVMVKRYQPANDIGSGDVAGDPAQETSTGHGGTSQVTGNTTTRINLNSGASLVNGAYNGWWIKILNGAASGNVRRIKSYTVDGINRYADIYTTADELATPQFPPSGLDFSSIPSLSDYSLHDCSYTALIFDESAKEWVLGCTPMDSSAEISLSKFMDLHVNNLTIDGVTTTGSGIFEGTVLIDETNPEVFLIRKDSDSGDIFRVDSLAPSITLINPNNTTNSENILNMSLLNDIGSEIVYSQISTKLRVNTDTFEDSQIIFRPVETGILTDYLILDANNLTVNCERSTIVDYTSTETFLVRKNLDAGDVFRIDTENSRSILSSVGGGTSSLGNRGSTIRNGNSNTFLNDADITNDNRNLVVRNDDSTINAYAQMGMQVGTGIGDIILDQKLVRTALSTGDLVFTFTDGVSSHLDAMKLSSTGVLTVTGGIEGINSSPSITVSASDLVNISSIGDVSVLSNKMDSFGDERTLYVTFSVIPTLGDLNTEFRFSLPELTTVSNTYDTISSIQGWLVSSEINLENLNCLASPSTNNGRIQFTSFESSSHIIQVVIRYTKN